MHLDEKITEVTTCGSEAMKHFFKSSVTAIVAKIYSKQLIEWQLWDCNIWKKRWKLKLKVDVTISIWSPVGIKYIGILTECAISFLINSSFSLCLRSIRSPRCWPYDVYSVMQYPFFAFTKSYDQNRPSMTLRDGSINAVFRETEKLSQIDILKTQFYVI